MCSMILRASHAGTSWRLCSLDYSFAPFAIHAVLTRRQRHVPSRSGPGPPNRETPTLRRCAAGVLEEVCERDLHTDRNRLSVLDGCSRKSEPHAQKDVSLPRRRHRRERLPPSRIAPVWKASVRPSALATAYGGAGSLPPALRAPLPSGIKLENETDADNISWLFYCS